MGFDDNDDVVLLIDLWLSLMIGGFGFLGFAHADAIVLLMGL